MPSNGDFLTNGDFPSNGDSHSRWRPPYGLLQDKMADFFLPLRRLSFCFRPYGGRHLGFVLIGAAILNFFPLMEAAILVSSLWRWPFWFCTYGGVHFSFDLMEAAILVCPYRCRHLFFPYGGGHFGSVLMMAAILFFALIEMAILVFVLMEVAILVFILMSTAILVLSLWRPPSWFCPYGYHHLGLKMAVSIWGFQDGGVMMSHIPYDIIKTWVALPTAPFCFWSVTGEDIHLDCTSFWFTVIWHSTLGSWNRYK